MSLATVDGQPLSMLLDDAVNGFVALSDEDIPVGFDLVVKPGRAADCRPMTIDCP
jgi:hypothetical protein